MHTRLSEIGWFKVKLTRATKQVLKASSNYIDAITLNQYRVLKAFSWKLLILDEKTWLVSIITTTRKRTLKEVKNPIVTFCARCCWPYKIIILIIFVAYVLRVYVFDGLQMKLYCNYYLNIDEYITTVCWPRYNVNQL